VGIDLEEIGITGSSQVVHALVAPDPQLTYQWVDDKGNALTDATVLPQEQLGGFSVTAPAEPAGYVGVQFWCANPNVVFPDYQPLEHKEWGFALLEPWTSPGYSLANNYGFTHSPTTDPYLVGCDKNTTSTADTAGLASYVAQAKANGFWEMPAIYANWDDSQDYQTQFKAISDLMYSDSIAAPDIPVWEVGIEENLNASYWHTDQYWNDLKNRISAIRDGLDRAHSSAKLIYQIAEPIGRFDDISFMFNQHHDVASMIDILSLHPYAWPDYPDPERWYVTDGFGAADGTYITTGITNMMNMAWQVIHDAGFDIPIFYTEVGAPSQENPNLPFGYGSSPSDPGFVSDDGLRRGETAPYLAKLQAMGQNLGVGMMSWYCYYDYAGTRWMPENYFGTVDQNGFPKPNDAAYVISLQHLNAKTATGMYQVGDIQVSKFTDGANDTYVIWKQADANRPHAGFASENVSLASLGVNNTPSECVGMLGTPLAVTDGAVSVGWDPIYVTVPVNENAAAGISPSADGNTYTLDLGAPYSLTGSRLAFDRGGDNLFNTPSITLRYTMEGSLDGKTWKTMADKSGNNIPGYTYDDLLTGQTARYLRVTVSAINDETVPALDDFQVYGGKAEVTAGGVTIDVPVTDGVANIQLTDLNDISTILANTGSTIDINLALVTDATEASITIDVSLLNKADKTIVITTADGTYTVTTQQLYNASGKNRIITIKNGVLSFTNDTSNNGNGNGNNKNK